MPEHTPQKHQPVCWGCSRVQTHCMARRRTLLPVQTMLAGGTADGSSAKPHDLQTWSICRRGHGEQQVQGTAADADVSLL